MTRKGFLKVKEDSKTVLDKIFADMDKKLDKVKYTVTLSHKEVGHLLDCLGVCHHEDGVEDKTTIQCKLYIGEYNHLKGKLETAPEVGSS